MFKHILIPTDGSARSMKAVKAGIALAKATAAKVTVLSVIEPTGVMGTDSRRVAATRQAYEQQVMNFAQRELADAGRTAKKQGVPCTTMLQKHAQPYQAIIDTARKRRCDLIAMASHGRKGVSALILGSETNKVLTHSRVPVLVYRFAA